MSPEHSTTAGEYFPNFKGKKWLIPLPSTKKMDRNEEGQPHQMCRLSCYVRFIGAFSFPPQSSCLVPSLTIPHCFFLSQLKWSLGRRFGSANCGELRLRALPPEQSSFWCHCSKQKEWKGDWGSCAMPIPWLTFHSAMCSRDANWSLGHW